MLDWTFYGNRFGGSGESQKDPAGPCLAHAAMACTRMSIVPSINSYHDFAAKAAA